MNDFEVGVSYRDGLTLRTGRRMVQLLALVASQCEKELVCSHAAKPHDCVLSSRNLASKDGLASTG
jgi:hypothetical protein